MGTVFKIALGSILLLFVIGVNSNDDEFKKGFHRFSYNLFEKFAASNPLQSVMISPLSVHMVLTVLYYGATGQTQLELMKALNIPRDNDIRYYEAVIQRLLYLQEVILKTANKIYVKNDPSYQFNESFSQLLKGMQTYIEKINFENRNEAAQNMNSWIAGKTDNKIPYIITPDSLDPYNTDLILLNAVYFKGDWKSVFEDYDTYSDVFYSVGNQKKSVEMMHQTGSFPYLDLPELRASFLELPYKNDEMSMVIILPYDVDGLRFVEEKLSSYNIPGIFKNMKNNITSIKLPQFQIETTIDLTNILPQIGIQSLFKNANLKNIFLSEKPSRISSAIQKSYIEVSEKGTVAAAATAFKVVPLSGVFFNTKPIEFFANHPFMFCIKTNDNIPVFYGQYTGY